ncbi:hypothetical protein W97_02132 [Coniosporium apollinis CBS 100218]|uniref:AHC1-like C2H2 zinc-finger domain-containing protein n=1 Tax=Coniosporium apollinis (strain CBS 100218) TaxID=1168221 RepID=R7YLW2_CONA1|nr:uncharacterized protein W97_02132 [Coniosporium apollinis CBS 100218]EON62907.1 hypothetical protein W97_02132 [Coniosporium apollinis CBS 100218]
MQTIWRLPWSSEPPCDKIMEKSVYNKPRQSPAVEIPLLKKLKRRRTNSPETGSPHGAHVAKVPKYAPGVAAVVKTELPNGATGIGAPALHVDTQGGSVAAENASVSDTSFQKEALTGTSTETPRRTSCISPTTISSPAMATDLAALRRGIEAQFNYEILLKHNELRLIEQELAKSQIALEQLRRCQLMPYPGATFPSEIVSHGVGPALAPPPGFTEPEHPAPYGVTDGPYSRHYAKWLIPDPHFDSVPARQRSLEHPVSRGARGSFLEQQPPASKRSSRGSAGSKLSTVPGEGQPAPGVVLQKRSTDGQWVRLVCKICSKDYFNNMQGFINHCRIKHSLNYKTHDQAANECGVPVDLDEFGAIIRTHEASHVAAALPPASAQVAATPFVHPLITTTPAPRPRKIAAPKRGPSSVKSEPVFKPVEQAPSDKPRINPAFVPSSQTPYMSAILQKRGFAGNLSHLVDSARTKIDLAALDPDDEDTDSVLPTPVERPLSRKGRLDGMRLAPTSLQPPRFGYSHDGSSDKVIPESPTMELSPNTAESNPGLMSDHDDDEEEEDDARSDVVMGDAAEFVDDVVVEDASDAEGLRPQTVQVICHAGPSRKA